MVMDWHMLPMTKALVIDYIVVLSLLLFLRMLLFGLLLLFTTVSPLLNTDLKELL